jgi:hypothetical protein
MKKKYVMYVLSAAVFSCGGNGQDDADADAADTSPEGDAVETHDPAGEDAPYESFDVPEEETPPLPPPTIEVCHDGTRDFETIQEGVDAAGPGDVVYICEGVYVESVQVFNSGAAESPIIVTAEPGAHVVIDGQENLPENWNYLLNLRGDYIQAWNMEIRSSAFCGAGLTGQHDEARNLNVHHSMEQGVLITGDYNLVEGCRVWWNAADNAYGERTLSYWATGLSAARHPSYSTIRNNVVYNNWGEGLSTFEAGHVVMEGNVVFDNWLNVYISDATNVLFQRNLVYSTPEDPATLGSQVGVALGDEQYNPPSSDITVINNIVVGCSRNFFWWQGLEGGGMRNILVAHNTFVDSFESTNLKIDDGDHENTRVENNIILQSDDLPIDMVADHAGLSFSHNLWSDPVSGTASSPDDVIGDPLLVNPGAGRAPDMVSADWFKLQESSPAVDAAMAISEVTEDFWGFPRGENPDMGAHEYE